MSISIVEYTIRDLAQALENDSLWQGAIYPISRHRALSQINNPRADEDDVALIVGFDNDKIIGFIGIVPGRIHLDDQPYRLGWLSSWWVDRKAGRNIGALLLLKAISRYDNQVAISAFTESAKNAYDATRRFVQLKNLRGATFHIRLELSRILPQRFPRATALGPLLRLADRFINLSSTFTLRLWQHLHGRIASTVAEIDSIDPATEAFIESHQRRELCRRGKAELDWIVRYPWILEAPPDMERDYDKFYEFSATARQFRYVNLRVAD